MRAMIAFLAWMVACGPAAVASTPHPFWSYALRLRYEFIASTNNNASDAIKDAYRRVIKQHYAGNSDECFGGCVQVYGDYVARIYMVKQGDSITCWVKYNSFSPILDEYKPDVVYPIVVRDGFDRMSLDAVVSSSLKQLSPWRK